MKNKKTFLLAMIPFFFIVFFFEILPLVMVIFKSFMPENQLGFTLDHYVRAFTKDLYTRSIINSFVVSMFSAFMGIVIAFLGARAAYKSHSKWKNFFRNVLNITSNFSGVPLAFSFMILFGNVGIFTLIGKQYGIGFLANMDVYSMSGLFMAYVYFQVPLATLLLIPAFASLKKEWEEAVFLLGGNSRSYWLKVAMPSLMPSILGTFSVLFANALAAYATGYALLSNNALLLPIRVAEQFVGDILPNREFGSALAVIMMTLMVTVTSLMGGLQKRSDKSL